MRESASHAPPRPHPNPSLQRPESRLCAQLPKDLMPTKKRTCGGGGNGTGAATGVPIGT